MIEKGIILTWSGGIDSTVLLSRLLAEGYEVITIYLTTKYGEKFTARELASRASIKKDLFNLFPSYHEQWSGDFILDGSFLWNFSPDGYEVPNRNKLIMEYILQKFAKMHDCYNIGMGEYIGADSWNVKDHVSMNDADARSLSAWLFQNYGLEYRLITLADFGESRFKHNRVELGKRTLGDLIHSTTNCLEDTLHDCGTCYKCVERHVAIEKIYGVDHTDYHSNPKFAPRYLEYVNQMNQPLK